MAARALQMLLLCNAVLLLQLLSPCTGLSLDTVREFLTREEDTIVFSLIERARYPLNRPAYDPAYLGFGPRHNASFAELFVRESEAVQSKAGRYQSLLEIPFFAYRVPFTMAPPFNFTSELYPAAAFVNVNDAIWSAYFNDLLPLLAKNDSDDGNYAVTVDTDLACLQALSRRINYGRFVAETKFTGDQQTYTSLIQSKDRDALMKLLTSEAQEDVVKRRVQKKAVAFGQSITLDGPIETDASNSSQAKFKVDPSVVYKLYDQWVIPLTKQVEVEYLLHRLD
ncbi:hypothetical protein QOZ80_8BG0661290 [Eleusine coracana subsp. coracana]|nr:hypothetical protein QOZ80_8BG0661290 [Eleusine coracana subsp. coracana]